MEKSGVYVFFTRRFFFRSGLRQNRFLKVFNLKYPDLTINITYDHFGRPTATSKNRAIH